jgi:glycogen(starch) synthase
MRTLYWTSFFLPDTGGMETLSAFLLPELVKRGHQLAVVASHGSTPLPDETDFYGIPIYRFHFRSAVRRENLGQLLKIRKRIATLKRAFKPDLVHIHVSDPSGFFHLQTLQAYPSPTLVSLHTNLADQNNTSSDTLMGQLLEKADWITGVSKATLENAIRCKPDIANRCSVIYNGIKTPGITPDLLPFDPPILLCLGRLIPSKNFDLVIEAMVILVKRYPHLRLIIAGDGLQRKELQDLTVSHKLEEQVEFIGWIPPEDVQEVLNKATLLVLPSRREGLPMAALEAANMARPIITTDVGGNPEIVLHQQTGLIVQLGDVQGLVEAIAYLLDNPKVAQEMGDAARRHTQEFFNLENTADAYDKIYHKLSLSPNSHLNS